MNGAAFDLERLLARLAAGAGPPDGSPSVAAVLNGNRENALRFLRTPYAARAVFVPQCLRSTTDCRAEQRGSEYLCKQCGECKICQIVKRAGELGYLGVRILKGGSALARLLGEARPKAVLGVACGNEGALGLLACERAGVPALCVPLSKDGCADTDVNLQDVLAVLEAVLP